MSRTHVTAILVVLTLAVPVSTAFAQAQAPSGTPTTGRQGRVGGGDVPNCQAAAGGAPMRANREPEATATTVRTEQTLKVSLDPPPQLNTPQCEATAATEYYQSNTLARADGTIKIRNCSTAIDGDLQRRGPHPGREGRDQLARIQRQVAAQRRSGRQVRG